MSMFVPQNSQAAQFGVRLLPAVVGFSAITAQILLLRELIVLSNGNELSLGVMLASWLAWSAAGSTVAGWLSRAYSDVRAPAIVALSLSGLCLPATIAGMRLSRALLTQAPTELLSLGAMLLMCILGLGVFCVLSGGLFTFAVRLYQQLGGISQPRALSVVYLLETAGTAIGGLLASLIFLRLLEPFQIALLVCTLDLCAGGALVLPLRRMIRAAIVVFIAFAGLTAVFRVAPILERSSQHRQWSPFKVIASRDSIYGRITVTEAGGMRSIYQDGNLLANVPDTAAAEEAVHYALLEHPLPKRVLLIGTSENGSIAEALKHASIEQLDTVELDPALPLLFAQLFSQESEKTDRRVHSHFGDGHYYLQKTQAKFDVILANVSDPESAQWNRFFTAEFFRLARGRLAPGGILALQLRSSEEFISPGRAEFLRSIRATLAQEFPRVAVIPGDPIHMFAAVDANALTEEPQVLLSRLHRRNIAAQYVNEYFLPFRMSPERLAYVNAQLQSDRATPINRDFHPVAYYFNQTISSAQFGSSYGILLRNLARIPFGSVIAATGAILLVAIGFAFRRLKSRRSTGSIAGWSVLAGGYCLMTLQVLLLLAFQCAYGYVYHALAMLIGMFMAGIAIGSWIGLRRAAMAPAILFRFGFLNQCIMAASGPVLVLTIVLIVRAPAEAAALAFPSIAFLSGIPGGVQFPIAAELAARNPQRSAWRGGSLYALDLLGGCAGALFIAGFLVPVYGLWNTAWLASLIGIGPAVLFVRASVTSTPSIDVPQTLRQ